MPTKISQFSNWKIIPLDIYNCRVNFLPLIRSLIKFQTLKLARFFCMTKNKLFGIPNTYVAMGDRTDSLIHSM